MKKLIGAILFLGLGACAHLESVSTTSLPQDRSRPVKAESYRFIFFGFNFNNDYVNEMTENLADQCPKGQVKGLLTKHEGITYFPLIAHAVRIEAKGFCVNDGGKAAAL